MSTKEKLLKRFKTKPTDFSWDELNTLLRYFGYVPVVRGKTAGSRARFIANDRPPILLHKPHPSSILKRYQIEYVYNMLQLEGLI